MQTGRPKYIQDYYLAWMAANPNQPRAWQETWENNLPYITWIGDRHTEFKLKVLGWRDTYGPYSNLEREQFLRWLFDLVGINEENKDQVL